MNILRCKECNALVEQVGDTFVRKCEGHEDKGIIADIGPLKLRGISAINQETRKQ